MEMINIKTNDGRILNVEPLMAFNTSARSYMIYLDGTEIPHQGLVYKGVSANEILNGELQGINPDVAPIISEIIKNCGTGNGVNAFEPIDLLKDYNMVGEPKKFALSDESINTIKNYYMSTGKKVSNIPNIVSAPIEEPTFNPFNNNTVTPVAPIVPETAREFNPFAAPAEPNVPATPVVPNEPVAPEIPNTIDTPAVPVMSNPFVAPVAPEVPVVPTVPNEVSNPIGPVVANTIDIPIEPAINTEVNEPVAPVIPNLSDTPVEPSVPNVTGEGLTTEQIIAGIKETISVFRASIDYYEAELQKVEDKNLKI